MTRKSSKYVSLAHYGLPDISMAAIHRYARKIAERFKPDKIILFGSFAYGDPNEHSDVDLLVVMPCPNNVTQAVRIRTAFRAPFAMDLIVRTPKKLRQRIKENCWFLREITEKGKVLYDKRNRAVGAKSRSRSANGKSTGKGKAPGP